MIVHENGLAHVVTYIISHHGMVRYGWNWSTCCHVENPCDQHVLVLNWSVITACLTHAHLKGRPKKGKATCLACLAQ